jgi:hypothetical protein
LSRAFLSTAPNRMKLACAFILEAFTLPGELPFELFGDAVTSTLASVLALFAGERPEMIDSLIRPHPLCRCALEACTSCVLLHPCRGITSFRSDESTSNAG